MIEYEGNKYELKYSLKRIEIIENAMKKSIMSCLQNGFMSINELTICTLYGMKKEGADAFLDPKKAKTIVEDILSEDGSYYMLIDKVAEALERDCPFFFPAG